MQSIKQLSEVDNAMVALVGGKAASLGEMIKAGINVPPGFVITTIVDNKGISPKVKKTVYAAFDKLGAELVAVRSSAVAEDSGSASWAGQLETYLNVTKDGLLDAIEKCQASIHSEHATEYADYNQVAKDGRAVAVIVQAMVDSEVSGILFTANPITGNREELVIESIYGLGEMIVQGMVTPDNWIINKPTGAIVSSSQRRQPKMLVYKDGINQVVKVPATKQRKSTLSATQIKQLTQVAAKIEQHYGQPQDIEWAIAKQKLYIVQSRPITTLGEQPNQSTFIFEKLFTREESLMVSEIQYEEFTNWLSQITSTSIPPLLCRIRDGLLETWLCREATNTLTDDIYQHNLQDKKYLEQNVARYQKLVTAMGKYEARQHARNLDELKAYLKLFRKIMIPLHVIFFTPFREDTPKFLVDLALKVRGEDAVFDTSDLYIRDSLAYIYPDCNGIETLIGLRDIDKPKAAVLQKRENDFFWVDREYLNLSFEQFSAKYPNYRLVIDKFDPNQQSITGTVAYAGNVRGEVQIITRKKDIANFREGNILVAPMTTPHYLPAMKKALAFVTNEGGVTCHAAIVAREMKKPCIIGTKVATEFLSNGDLIRVDANNGIVTVKKRSADDCKLLKLAERPPAPKGVKYALTVPQSVLFTELSFQACLRPVFQEALNMDYELDYLAIDANGAMSWNYDSDKTFDVALIGDQPIETALSSFVDLMTATARRLERHSSSLASAHTRRTHNRDDILEDLQEYWQAYRLHQASLCSFWNVENLLARAITNELRHYGHETALQGLDQFIKSRATNQYMRERNCFEKIVRRFAGDQKNLTAQTAPAELLAALRHHAREFGFLFTPFNLGEVPTGESLLPRVSEVRRSLRQKRDDKTEPVMPDLGVMLTSKLKHLTKILEQLTYWKNERIDVLSMADAKLEPLYQAAAESLNLSVDQLFTMTSGEVEASIKKGALTVGRQVLSDRAVAFCMVLHDGKIDFYEPALADEAENPSNGLVSGLLQGVGSSSGTAKGRVRLLLSLDQASELKTGEVLVTTMTRPEMGAALDRAAAFVTDEGGLLCHAAIISREMKKPCVIATAKATKVLQTGDLVEVDGSKGTVRLII